MKSLFLTLLIHGLLCALSFSAESASEVPDRAALNAIIRKSQILLAEAKPREARKVLLDFSQNHPAINRDPMYCYQHFFISLEGLGDRKTADLMLKRLHHLVEKEIIAADSQIFKSVTSAWVNALLYADGDLQRRANQIMTYRLALSKRN